MLDRFSFKKAKFRSDKNNFQKLLSKNKVRRSKIAEPLSVKILVEEENEKIRDDETFFIKYFKEK